MHSLRYTTLLFILIFVTVIMYGEAYMCLFTETIFTEIILQKRIIRMIMGAKPRDHTEPMFLKLGLLKFVDINKYLIAVFMYGHYIARIPDVFVEYFKRIQDVPHYATRSCAGLYAMQVKTNLGKRVFPI